MLNYSLDKMYTPSEDSFFFSDFLKKYLSKISEQKKEKILYLDMGSGSGILAETALKAGIKKENILAVDIDKESINLLRKKGFNTVKSDLFSNSKLKNKKFDLIIFNSPYLPSVKDKTGKFDNKKDTTGGKKGDEISLKFLKQAKYYLNKNGKIFLLISSRTPMERIKNFKPKIVARKKLFFEELCVLEFKIIRFLRY